MDKIKRETEISEQEQPTARQNLIRKVKGAFIALLVLVTFSGMASAEGEVNFSKIINLMEEMPAVIAPITDIIAEMIVIMAYLAVAGLIIGIFSGIVMWINNSFSGFRFK